MTRIISIPVITARQMAEVDRLAEEEFHFHIIQMMELAGRNLAEVVRQQLNFALKGRSIAVVAGKGNNGGGGLVAARHLLNYGAKVTVLLPDARLHSTAARQKRQLKPLPIPILCGQQALDFLQLTSLQLVVDALIGYNLKGAPRGIFASFISYLNQRKEPVVALDIPSGLDATQGTIYAPCVRAQATLTLALPKQGLFAGKARDYVGKLFLGDIGIPLALYRKMGLPVGNIFEQESILEIDVPAGEQPLSGKFRILPRTGSPGAWPEPRLQRCVIL